MTDFDRDLLRTIRENLKLNKQSMDVNNLLLMRELNLINNDELKESKIYKDYVKYLKK